jgi:integrative and conjugative element protein (TIGR02256 family)
LIIEHRVDGSDFKVFISIQVLERLYEVSMPYIPKEFGGILTGIRKINSLFILDFEVPSRIENSKSEFVRHIENINAHLADIYAHSEGILEYLGEWHTHPNHSADYSSNDMKSMLEISKDAEIRINTPVLIILSLSDESHSYKLYQVHGERIVWLNKITAL